MKNVQKSGIMVAGSILVDKINGGNTTVPIYLDGKMIAKYIIDLQKRQAFATSFVEPALFSGIPSIHADLSFSSVMFKISQKLFAEY